MTSHRLWGDPPPCNINYTVPTRWTRLEGPDMLALITLRDTVDENSGEPRFSIDYVEGVATRLLREAGYQNPESIWPTREPRMFRLQMWWFNRVWRHWRAFSDRLACRGSEYKYRASIRMALDLGDWPPAVVTWGSGDRVTYIAIVPD